jgi:hypothetical protein
MSVPAGTDLAATWGTGITDAGTQAVDLVKDNSLVLLAMPLIWVGYRVAKRVIGKIAG